MSYVGLMWALNQYLFPRSMESIIINKEILYKSLLHILQIGFIALLTACDALL
jgi:hypothetical protein